MNSKIILLSSVAAVNAAFAATVKSGNAVGVANIVSGSMNTLLAVPFESGYGGGPKTVSGLVDEFVEDGDQIVFFDTATRKQTAFCYDAATQTWKNGGDGEGADVMKAPAPGKAVWYVRKTAEGKQKQIRLSGLVPESGYGDVTVGEQYTLLANPRLEPFHVNAAGAITGANEGDMIVIPRDAKDDITYRYFAAKGGWTRGKDVEETKIFKTADGDKTVTALVHRDVKVEGDEWAVPAGTGFWYVKKEKDGNSPTIKWK